MQATYPSLDAIPEALREHYAEKEGKFLLKIDGEHPTYVPAAALLEANNKVNEFRNNNVGLKTKLEELEAKVKGLEGVDVEEYKALKEKAAELERKGVKGADDIAELVRKNVEAAVTPLTTKLADMEKRESEAKSALARRDVESKLTAAGLKAGIRDTAMADYLRRGLEIGFVVDGENLIAMKDGVPVTTAKGEKMTAEAFLSALNTDAPHLFKPTNGNGSTGSSGGGTAGKKTFDPNDDKAWLDNLEGISKGEVVRQE